MISEKLGKRDREVLESVLSFAGKKTRVLVSAEELLASLPVKRGYDGEKLEERLAGLERDGYFILTRTDRKGEKMYVFELLDEGLNYVRTGKQLERRVWFKVGLAALGAVVTFVVGMVLKSVFKH